MAIESAVGSANANSFVSVSDADAYFADNVQESVWTLLSVDQKEAFLIGATQYIDTHRFKGNRVTSTQALSFPRTGLYNRDGVLQNSTMIPIDVKKATYELAIYTNNNAATLTTGTSNTTEIKVGPITIKKDLDKASSSSSTVNDLVSRLLDPYVIGSVGGVGFEMVLG